MGGIGEEAPLGLAGALETGQHGVQRLCQPPHLVSCDGLGQSPGRITGPLDLRRCACEPRQRRQGATHEHRQGDRSEAGAREGGDEDERADARKRRREVARRRRDRDRAARRRTARLGERRNVEAQIVRAELGVRVAAATGRDHGANHILNRQDATAERERASDDPPLPVDDLDAQLPAAEWCVERAWRSEQRRRRRAQLCNR